MLNFSQTLVKNYIPPSPWFQHKQVSVKQGVNFSRSQSRLLWVGNLGLSGSQESLIPLCIQRYNVQIPEPLAFRANGLFLLMFASTSPTALQPPPLSPCQICPPRGLQGIHLKAHVTLSLSRSKLLWLPVPFITWVPLSSLEASPSNTEYMHVC